MKTLMIITAAFALAVPAALAAPGDNGTSPAQDCKKQQIQLGTANFVSAYGGNASTAFSRCIAAKRQQAALNHTNAAKACKADLASMGATTFATTYGNNPNDKNAMGKCVSSKEAALHAAQLTAETRAGRACKTERTTLGAAAFKAKYGGKANAFAKCIAAAKAAQQ